MNKHLACILITVLTFSLFLVGCGGSGGSSINPGPIVVPTATPTLNPVPTATPTLIPTPPIVDPTPTQVYTTDPDDFGPLETGKAHINIVTYYIDTTNRELTGELEAKLALSGSTLASQEVIDNLVASGVLKLLPNTSFRIYNEEGGSVLLSAETGADSDYNIENWDPKTYWFEFYSDEYSDIKRNQEIEGGYINIVNAVFDSP